MQKGLDLAPQTPEIHNHYYTTPQTPQPQQYSQPVQTINPITPYQNYYPQTQQMSMGYNTGYYNQPSYIQQPPVANYAYSEENLRGKPGYVEPVYKGEMEIARMSRMQNVQNFLSRFNPFNNTNSMMRNPFSNCYPVANYVRLLIMRMDSNINQLLEEQKMYRIIDRSICKKVLRGP